MKARRRQWFMGALQLETWLPVWNVPCVAHTAQAFKEMGVRCRSSSLACGTIAFVQLSRNTNK